MKKKFLITIAALCACFSLPAFATLNIFACEPEWSALATEIGGDKVKAFSATTAQQDPHRIEARPSLIARARNADLVVCTGMELEAGWLPLLLQQSGNARIAPGQRGFLEAGSLVPHLDVPVRVDRSEGDVHAAGNPHIQLDPRNISRVAEALAKRLAEIDAANGEHYLSRHKDFTARWSAAIQRWEQQAAPLKGVRVIEQHRNMAYLMHWLGLQPVAALEPKPGVEPSAAHLSGILNRLQQQPAKMVLTAAYQDTRPSQWLAERARIPVAILPFTVGGNDRVKDLTGLFDDTVQRLLEAAK